MTTTLREPVTAPAVKTIALERGTFLTTDLAAARRLFEEVLDLECVRFERDALLVRERGHRPGEARAGEPYWVLEVREVAAIANPQALLNHWGVFVSTQGDVDRAYQKLVEHKDAYGIVRVQRPCAAHGAYSFYFQDRDSNWWEVEHRIPKRQYTALRERGDAV
jgi:catechol 2,3-dioxygenase-like lactoylglutathione lyase family enzyme